MVAAGQVEKNFVGKFFTKKPVGYQVSVIFLGIDIINVYGSTENSPIVTGMFKGSTYDQKINTVGYPIEHQEIKVVGKDRNILPIERDNNAN